MTKKVLIVDDTRPLPVIPAVIPGLPEEAPDLVSEARSVGARLPEIHEPPLRIDRGHRGDRALMAAMLATVAAGYPGADFLPFGRGRAREPRYEPPRKTPEEMRLEMWRAYRDRVLKDCSEDVIRNGKVWCALTGDRVRAHASTADLATGKRRRHKVTCPECRDAFRDAGADSIPAWMADLLA